MIVSLQNVPKNLENVRKKGKPENGNIYWTILQTFQCGSQLLFINVSIHWEDISWSYLSKMHPKTYKNYEKRKTWKCQYLLNHSINFSVRFTTTFYECFYSLRGYMMIVSLQNVSENLEKLREKENLKMPISTNPFYKLFSTVHNYFLWMFLIIERIYDDRIHPKCPQKLRKCSKNEKLKMRISTKPFYKLFSVVHNNFQWMCLISERIYDDRIPRKCSQKLRKFANNLKPENANIYQVILQTFQCGSQLLAMNVFNHWEEIWWSYPCKMSPKT